MDLRLCVCLVLLTRLRLFVVGQIFTCHSNQWQCDDGSCISALWRCDGEGDCLDGTDEMDCDSSPCPRGQFSCVDSMNCVDMSARCDGKKQCPTGYDEENCEHKHGCLNSEWTCNNHICIPMELRCNGQNDCLDNSDELNCGPCSAGIRCPDGKCLSPEKRCDGTVDCEDGRDEPITCGRICSLKNGGCSHSCADEPWGALCSCPEGYELSFDGAICKDVDECSLPRASCMQSCVNTVGSYYCQCQKGFTVTKGSTCLATGNITRLVTVQRNTLGLLDVRSRHFEVVQFSVFEPVALAFDLARGLYYWADGRGRIRKTDGRQTWTIFTGQPGIRSLACDWLNGQLYWTNQETRTIYMQVADGESYTTVLNKNVQPSDLVLLPVESLMFWINAGAGERVTIEKSWMDGTDRSSLVVLTAQSAHGLTADVAAGRLYWISDSKKSIETVKVDGSGRYSFRGVFSRGPALSLTVFEQFFFWSDKKGLWQAPVLTSNQRRLIWKDPLPLISAFHELQQPQVPSPCVGAPCQMCLLTKTTALGFTCTCPNSKVLLPTGMCEYPRVVYGTFRTVNFVEFKDGEATEAQLFTTDEGIVTFDVDWYRDWFYWANETGHLKRASLTQVKTEMIQTSSPVCQMKVDQRSGNLYWVPCDQKSINVISADSPYSQKLYDSQRLIEALYLDWMRGRILWLEEDHIFTFSLMGGKPIALLHLGGGVVGTLAFDLRANSLLWNSNPAGLVTMSLFWARSHVVGKRWNITGSVAFALEPFLLSLSDNTMTLWDRRDGKPIQSIAVQSNVLSVVQALKDLRTDSSQESDASLSPLPQSKSICKSPSVLCPQSSVLCISPSQVCDGFKDCPDGFDENNCVKRCASKSDFLCKDRRSCVSQDLVCDGRAHCMDGSDEMSCQSLVPPASAPNVLKCRYGSKTCRDGSECILFSHVCDGQRDCADGSDEDGCDALNTSTRGPDKMQSTRSFIHPSTKPPCRSPSSLCPGSSVCILETQFCDGRKDCPDGSDEKCVKRCSYTSDFLCKDRRSCVSQNLVCDGRAHCLDASDERNCPSLADSTPRPNIHKCRFGSWSCADGSECVLFSHVCDGQRDCADGSDEDGCDALKTSTRGPDKMQSTRSFIHPSTKPPCRSPSSLCPGSSVCILETQFCDGRKDCPDGSDEECVQKCPYMSDFLCKDRRSCVSQNMVCDGRAHCLDASDERNCPSLADPTPRPNIHKCRFGSWSCADGSECVLFSHVCDGQRDCADGSDEDGCEKDLQLMEQPPPTQLITQPPTKPPCRSPSSLCPGSSVCILETQFCDGRKDCPDGSDEKCVKRCSYTSDFLCKDRRSCVSQNLVCDGRAHCLDASDERNCPSLADPTPRPNIHKCRFGSWSCADGSECVLFSHVCDGQKDCADGSDEDGCEKDLQLMEQPPPTQLITQPPTKPPCRSPSSLCPGSSVCILETQFCDGRKDCPDGSDEKCVKRCSYTSDFLCKDRRSCVSQNLVCDGRAHCLDASDERNCPSLADSTPRPNIHKCRFGSWSCADGSECVLFSHVCDGQRDCADGSDEDGCDALKTSTRGPDKMQSTRSFIHPSTKPPCQSPSSLCPGSSVCILETQFCDGRKDCPDGSDEECVQKCPYMSDFLCKDRRRCVSQNMVCDGRAHCLDASDERNCPSLADSTPRPNIHKCRFGSWSCADGSECVLFSHVCDGQRDCADGSDEDGCATGETTTSPAKMKFSTSPFIQPPTKPACRSPSSLCPGSSVCILETQFCDGTKDCPDGSDEKCVQRCLYKDDFLCKDRRSCVSQDLVCDGRAHCMDGSDERNCQSLVPPASAPNVLRCRYGSKTCRDGSECILFSHVCDGHRDCNDGSDEDECDDKASASTSSVKAESSFMSKVKWSCASPSVLCPESSQCILPTQFCDGKLDCPGGFDENCETRCPDKSDFLCKDDLSCVSKDLVCNGHTDCSDGSDELKCPDITPTPSGALRCPHGSKPCRDGSECVLLSHLCDGEDDCQDASDELLCPKSCKEGEFQCAHGKMCILTSQVCDGKVHCLDHSDEINCWKQTQSCEFHCLDGKRCIPKKFLCDGEKDCEDGTDEQGCAAPPSCTAPSVLCPGTTTCVSQSQLCDDKKDCPDGFDEQGCILQCENPADFLCQDKKNCIPPIKVCDGRAHCFDSSDERLCTTPLSPLSAMSSPLKCRLGFKLCKDGLECVMYSHVCDGESDCKDGSDEEDCVTVCKADEFQCAHGKGCIPKEQVCDGQSHCQDRSDEINCKSFGEGCHQWCDNNTRCIPDTFLCDGERDCADGSDEIKCGLVACTSNQYRCQSGQCVSQALRCDGYADCGDHSDEKDCSRPPRCPGQLRCPNSHECLQKEWICDGENDCTDGADEKNCKTAPVKCKEYQWQCGDRSQCIPLSWRCDGKEDCENGKDEDNCNEKKCAPHLYKCGSGECLEPRQVCNSVTNCADRSDEGAGCNQRNCSSSLAPQCDHNCVSTPSGPRCFCVAGFQPQSNGMSCVDIDECSSVASGVCKHICLNTRGSYVCHCHPGFYLEPDKRSCKTEDEPLLLASVQSEMVILSVHRGTLRVLSSANRPVFSLDYDWVKNKIYWLSSNYQSIRWAEMNNTNNKGTLIKGVKSDFIAVDWVGKNLYWVDGLLGQILAVKLSDATVKAQDHTVVLGEDLEQPSSLVLVSHKGLMFWSEIGSTPQIEQAGMDGSKRKVVVSRGLSWPVSLAFDVLDNRIYWADEKLRCIGSASMDGDNVKILQLAETPSPFSVSVFNDRVFWSDTKKRSIRSADKRTGKDQKVLVKRPGQPFALKIMHPLSQPSVSNPCEQLPCSHVCLLAPAVKSRSGDSTKGLTAVCRCPKGLLLSKDNLKCTVPMESTFIMLLSLQTIYQIHLHSMYSEGVGLKKIPNGRVLALPAVNEASSMDASIPGLTLYVADAVLATVDKLKLSDSRSGQPLLADGQILKLSQDDSVSALAVDWVTSNLYWSSSKRLNLRVTSSEKGHTASLLPGSMKGTTSIAVHPPSGRLCYTAVGLTGIGHAEVSCAWMDGRKRTVLWRKSSVPTSLVFSDTGTVIYWADTGEGVIYTIGVDGSGFKQYKTGPGFIISFTFIENFMLWMTFDKDVTRLWFSDGLQPKHLWFETKISLIEIKAYSNSSQSGSNSCAYNNGGCAHLCLPYPGGNACRCGLGFYTVNVSSCASLPSCPSDTQMCPDGSKCISSSQFCDSLEDCRDGSDEQDCPYTDFGLSGPRSNKSSQVASPLVPSDAGSQKKSEVSCDLQCNGRGACVTEGTVSRCQCVTGYKGDFCQVAETSHSGRAVGLGLFFVFALLIGGILIYIKRRDLALALSTTREKETLMSNISLPSEHFDYDTEELDSPVDGKSPGLTLESLQLKQ